MTQLELLHIGARLAGLLPHATVTVTGLQWRGTEALELFFKDSSGRADSQLLLRDDEARLELVQLEQSPRFDGDGALFRLVCEAHRIKLAHLFDPHLAVHASQVEPLPHQISAVYGDLLARQPLRFLLADDPGAGKTVMTGLYLKELAMRGDLRRALIVCPGSLAEQWQDELGQRFGLDFEILTRDALQNSRTGNPLAEKDFLIARLDQLARGDEWHDKLRAAEFDAVVVDEAHKMSASFFGGEMKATKRYRLGQILGEICRHFLLLTATPHNGKEEDFQFFMALLDPDRFEGRFRSGVHTQDVSDVMRRRVKEELYRFDGTRLFPERRAYSVNYTLSDPEMQLYESVTDYVREEMNRADKLDGKSGATVGFALTVLQRRLASSPEAILQSISRRRKRLEARHAEAKAARNAPAFLGTETIFMVDAEGADDFYEEHAPDEVEEVEDAIALQASASRTLAELAAEIRALERLETLASQVRNSAADRKWDELSRILQGEDSTTRELFDSGGERRKLIIFTEHRDTLNYLANRIRTLLGREEAVVSIHGGVSRDERRRVQEAFTQDKEVLVLLATDAAGEGINLQHAHLMVNYDLPWNPNRIEQRFGRIHRIGQTEVCHLWNLVAAQTREGDVWQTLLTKLENQRLALGSGVFDVLGQCFEGNPLRQLLIDAVRYGDQPQVRARLLEKLEDALDTDHLKKLLEERVLATDSLSLAHVGVIRGEMERAQARRLQPHYISQFFQEAFATLGGDLKKREAGRFEISRVPRELRERGRTGRMAILPRYERITFERGMVHLAEKPPASLVCPGHPLLDASIALVLEHHGDVLKSGTVLIDEENRSSEIRVLWMLEHAIQDGRSDTDGRLHYVSQRLQWVEMEPDGTIRDGGSAPYLDYRAASREEKEGLAELLSMDWLQSDLESQALDYAASHLVPAHLSEVRAQKQALLDKTRGAVTERLTKEIAYWDGRALELQAQEEAGKPNARLNSSQARTRADDLEARLHTRLQSLERERHLAARPPIAMSGAIIVPQSLVPAELRRAKAPAESNSDSKSTSKYQPVEEPPLAPELKKKLDALAVQTALATERAWGHSPQEMEHNNPGYDIESLDGETGQLRFLEVKGKLEEYGTVTVSRTQILTALGSPESWYLVIVPIKREGEGDDEVLTPGEPFYLQRPFTKEPDFAATSVNFDLHALLGGNAEGSNFL